MDRVLFCQALCWRRLADDRPWRAGVPWPERDARLAESMRNVVEALDRCARTFPDSPLADDCLRALAWWRRARPAAFARPGAG
jgi:hypothetical protein